MQTEHSLVSPVSLSYSVLIALSLAAPPVAAQGLFGLGGASSREAGAVAEAAAPAAPRLDEAGLADLLRRRLEAQRRDGVRDRHAVGDRYNPTRPSRPGRPLVVVFEGTGAYEAHVMAALQGVGPAVQGRLDPALDGGDVYDTARALFKEVFGVEEAKWSGLGRGPLDLLYRDASLVPGGFDWLVYPSEEAEVLAGLDAIGPANLARLPDEVARSRAVWPKTLARAYRGTLRYLAAAARAGAPRPKIVVLGHSSGCRSVVKFLEDLRRAVDPFTGERGVSVELAFTFDPVVEAHHAVVEAAGGLVKQGASNLGRGTAQAILDVGSLGPLSPLRGVTRRVRVPPAPAPTIGGVAVPDKLYKTRNARRWASVRQDEDTKGLKMNPKFGIHGGPVRGADVDEPISGVGAAGHGEICYHAEALEIFGDEVRRALGVGGGPAD